MNKKFITIILVASMLLCACGNSSGYTLPKLEDFEMSYGCTNKNVGIGDSGDTFVKAYKGYLTSVKYPYDDGYNVIKIENIDYSNVKSVIIPSFFIDGESIGAEEFKKDNNITTDLNEFFEGNDEYLSEHSVIYKCIIFSFEDGKITNIDNYDVNYNDNNKNKE